MNIDKPRFELTSVYTDSVHVEPRIVPFEKLPLETKTNRRSFLGVGLAASSALLFLNNCKKDATPEESIDSNIFAHCDEIVNLSFSPNGKSIASRTLRDLNLWLWPSGKLISLPLIRDYQHSSMIFSPDGDLLLSEAFNYTSRQSRKILWSLLNGSLINIIEQSGEDIISPDGKILASASGSGIYLRSLPSGLLLTVFDKVNSYSAGTNLSICFSPDSKILASTKRTLTNSEKNIKLWSVQDGQFLKTLEGHNDKIKNILIAHDGKYLVSDSWDNSIKFWSLPDGNNIKTLEGHTKPDKLLISYDGKILASSSSDGLLRLWSLPEGRLIQSFYESNVFAISHDGNYLATASAQYIILKSISNGAIIKTFYGHTEKVTSLSFSPDGKTLASGSVDKSIRLWDLQKMEFHGFLFDAFCNYTKGGVVYNSTDKITGSIITFTLPCGSQIPVGSSCTCNCVPGRLIAPTTTNTGSGCTCNKVCTCIPICQAHKLLYSDQLVSSLSREILLFMGLSDLDYMQWAANRSIPRLKSAIKSIIQEIKKGVKPDPLHWPSILDCKKYLNHQDEVIAVMAAQMINMHCMVGGQTISNDLRLSVDKLLMRSEELHWKKRLV